MNDSVETFRRDCVETYDTTVEHLEELLFLHTVHVNYGVRVVVRVQMLVSFESWIRIRVHRSDECV